jgi:hypothetical protein
VSRPALLKQHIYAFANSPAEGFPRVCHHVISYVLDDLYDSPQGMYCTLFTKSWDARYGTVTKAAYADGEYSTVNVFL